MIYLLQAFVVGQMRRSWRFMAYFNTITRDMIVRQAGSNRILYRWIKDLKSKIYLAIHY